MKIIIKSKIWKFKIQFNTITIKIKIVMNHYKNIQILIPKY